MRTNKAATEIRKYFEIAPAALRRAAYWASILFVDTINPDGDEDRRWFFAERSGLVSFVEHDISWLKQDLADLSRSPDQREHVLGTLFRLIGQTSANRESEIQTLKRYVEDLPKLCDQVDNQLIPRVPNPEYERIDREHRLQVKKHDALLDEQRQQWKEFEKFVKSTPDVAFSDEHVNNTTFALWNMYSSTTAFT